MTQEEAVELVLDGRAWVVCGACDHRGLIPAPSGQAAANVTCPFCKGEGYKLLAPYEEAYALLELEVPKRPRNRTEFLHDLAGLGGSFIRDQLRRTSLLRQLLPPEQIPDPPKDEDG